MTTTKNNEHKKLNFSSEREQSQACLNSAEHEKNQGRKVLNVPNLRFPEFEGEWEKCKLGDVMNFSTTRVNSSELNEDNYVSTENMLQDYQGIVDAKSVPEDVNVISFSCGDILISNIRPYLKKVWKATYNGGCSSDVFVLKANDKIESDYLHYVIANDKFINFVMSGAKGVKMPRGDKKQMKTYCLSLPQIQEQKKISTLLRLIDERISTQSKIIDKLQSLIKGIMASCQNSGLKNNTWGKISLCDVLTERKELNKQLHPVFSVSVSQGVINQIEYLGRSFAAKDTSKYNVVHFGDIIYTKSPTGDFPYGIVKQNYNQEEVAVSPLYGVYAPKTYSIGVFLHEYFKSNVNTYNYLHPLIQKGAKNTINITNQHFLENKVAMPFNDDELESISKLLLSLNAKVVLMQHIKGNYEQQKQYLLRQMFI